MKALRQFLFLVTVALLLQIVNLPAQNCEYWSDPVAISDSNSDNRSATMANLRVGDGAYYIFWERTLDLLGSEIVYIDYYDMGVPETAVYAEGFIVSNPQVISLMNWAYTDTLAFLIYQSNQSGNEDIYLTVMTNTGFTEPVPFANSTADEKHLRVSPGGGMVWQEGDKIQFTRLRRDNSGFYFEPVVTIDEDACRNPDIQNTDPYTGEQYIIWEKGNTDSTEIWYSMWGWDSGEWSPPVLLYDDAKHSNPRFSNGLAGFSSFGFPLLVSDQIDSSGQYHISAYDFYFQDEFISAFSQSMSFQPDFYTIDLLTQDYWELGYLAFKNDEGNGNSTIFSSDDGILSPEFYNYCRIDNSSQAEAKPQLFEGAWHFGYFDLVCIWESWRNGHWQLFSSTTPVVFGNVPDNQDEDDVKVRAYPNPFTDQVTFNIRLQDPAKVNLAIFNNLGQLVATILDESMDKGVHEVTWNAENLPSGIYFYRISTIDHRKSTMGKMVVVK